MISRNGKKIVDESMETLNASVELCVYCTEQRCMYCTQIDIDVICVHLTSWPHNHCHYHIIRTAAQINYHCCLLYLSLFVANGDALPLLLR